MRIKYGSDFHAEYGSIDFPQTDDDKNTVLVLLGDQGRNFQYGQMCGQFKHVIAVAGNHDYYGKTIKEVDTGYFAALQSSHSNFHFLQCGEIVIDDVRFLGCTLWTDLRNGHPLTVHTVANAGNDFRKIHNQNDDDHISPEEIMSINREHQAWLRNKLNEPRERTTIVLTHFAPDRICRDRRHRDDEFSFYTTNSNMRDVLECESWDTWLFGHVHSKQRHIFETTDGRRQQLLANPRGYPHREDVSDFHLEELNV